VDEQQAKEHQAAEAEVVLHLLAERDRRLLDSLRGAPVPADLLRQVEDYLRADREARRPVAEVERRLFLSEDARSLLRHLRQQRLDELVREATGLLEKLGRLGQEREDLERLLAATPGEADINQVAERLKNSTHAFALLEEEARQRDAELEARKAELKDVGNRLERLWQGKIEEEFEREDALRMIELAGRTRETMQEFLRRATAQKIDRLSALITESFRFLLHKQRLVERILIDPVTFAITLYGADGQALPRHRLSEGEKQIFAVSVLWGLARAAARPLPAVIDTPMARLDAAHRRHLVERYFPHASH
jgi:DNA sulfur modification protein DndD